METDLRALIKRTLILFCSLLFSILCSCSEDLGLYQIPVGGEVPLSNLVPANFERARVFPENTRAKVIKAEYPGMEKYGKFDTFGITIVLIDLEGGVDYQCIFPYYGWDNMVVYNEIPGEEMDNLK